ncbi:hypothetical protein L3X38_018076 [Prunus dulcis]|uniref:Uncharacterized protein n=1 Tax=Prunus dulcis TaxID=3755 RepID=A0AAD4W8J4_PRUDU|nr:hypothetical protein L3X38_018076 [Prunus dulcis]
MGRRGEAKMDLEVGEKLLKFGIIKLPTVVCDNCLGYAEATDDVFPNECLNASCCDGSKSFSFGSLGEGLCIGVDRGTEISLLDNLVGSIHVGFCSIVQMTSAWVLGVFRSFTWILLNQLCKGINIAIFRAWDLVDAISTESFQQLMGIVKVRCHGGVLGKEVLIDLMNDELGVAEYLNLFRFHLFG